jgi:hypothetical protein
MFNLWPQNATKHRDGNGDGDRDGDGDCDCDGGGNGNGGGDVVTRAGSNSVPRAKAIAVDNINGDLSIT